MEVNNIVKERAKSMIKPEVDELVERLHNGETVEIDGLKLKSEVAQGPFSPCAQCPILQKCIALNNICGVCASMDFLEYVKYNQKNRYYLVEVKEEEDNQ